MSDTIEFVVDEHEVPRCTSTITLFDFDEDQVNMVILKCTRRLGHANEHVVESRRDGRGPDHMMIDFFKLEWLRESGY